MDQSLLSSRAIIGRYFARMESAPGLEWVDQVANLYLSDQVQEQYPSLGSAPPMRLWVGGRQSKGLTGRSINIANRRYEATLEVRVEDARRDKTGQIQARIDEFADGSTRHWMSLLSELIASGETQLCYDGAPLFSASHQERDSGVQSNSIQVDISTLAAMFFGTPAHPSLDEIRGSISRGMQQIWTLKDDHGEPLNEGAKRFLVMVPPSRLLTFQHAVDKLNQACAEMPAETRVEVSLAVNARLSWSDKFAVFRTDGDTKALIRQSETDVRLLSKAEGSEHEFETDTWHFGIDASRAVGFGHWQRACLVQMV